MIRYNHIKHTSIYHKFKIHTCAKAAIPFFRSHWQEDFVGMNSRTDLEFYNLNDRKEPVIPKKSFCKICGSVIKRINS